MESLFGSASEDQSGLRLAEFAKKILGDVISHAQANQPGVCSILTQVLTDVSQVAERRDHHDVARSWPLITATAHGPWFENLPIELFPELPNQAMSPILLERVQRLAQNSAKHAPETPVIFEVLFEEKFYQDLSESDKRHVQWLGMALLLLDHRPWSRDRIYNRTWPSHRDVSVRSMIVSLAYIDLPWPPAERALYAATHDTDEPVFIKAFRICGKRHDERAMDHLMPIVRSPAAVLKELSEGRMHYPVGHAACSICPSQFAILCTDEPALAAQREQELLSRSRRPLCEPVEHARNRLEKAIAEFVQPAAPKNPPKDLHDMIEIPGGPFIVGVDPTEANPEIFNWSTCSPRKEVFVPTFHIDKYPVTNEQYDKWEAEFKALPAQRRQEFEHPGQKQHKNHERNTKGDNRFGPDHPVVGIDWFDAWAYARFYGKELPTEQQWEKAARGNRGNFYPWGDEFHAHACRHAGETYQYEPRNLLEWVILLSRGTHHFPETTTAPVNAHPEGVSPYGVWDMCGNAWEFTRTSFFTGETVRAAFANFTPVELMGVREGHVVIKGGAWSSPTPLIGAAYRGYDLLTDRHTEIGFRCVWSSPEAEQINKTKTKGEKK